MYDVKCPRCGVEFPSRHYFAASGLCNTCLDSLSEAERAALTTAKPSSEAPAHPPDRPSGYLPGVDIPFRRRVIAYSLLALALVTLPFPGAGIGVALTGNRLSGIGGGLLLTHLALQVVFPFLAFRPIRVRFLFLGLPVELFCLLLLYVVNGLGFSAGGYGILDWLITTVIGSVIGWEVAYQAFVFELPTMPPPGWDS